MFIKIITKARRRHESKFSVKKLWAFCLRRQFFLKIRSSEKLKLPQNVCSTTEKYQQKLVFLQISLSWGWSSGGPNSFFDTTAKNHCQNLKSLLDKQHFTKSIHYKKNSSKCCTGHVECSSNNPAENFMTEVKKIFRRGAKKVSKEIFLTYCRKKWSTFCFKRRNFSEVYGFEKVKFPKIYPVDT